MFQEAVLPAMPTSGCVDPFPQSENIGLVGAFGLSLTENSSEYWLRSANVTVGVIVIQAAVDAVAVAA